MRNHSARLFAVCLFLAALPAFARNAKDGYTSRANRPPQTGATVAKVTSPLDSSCPASQPLSEHLVNPVGIKSYVEANKSKFKDPGDLICCLPKKYRENYVVAHTSNAAQSSHARSPRVLLFSPLRQSATSKFTGEPLEAIVSINGGDPALSNHMNVEVMFNNKKTQEVELFDIDFSEKHPHMSGRNPDACIQCHGSDNTVGVGGPKTIFDPPFQWVRFIKGNTPCTEEEKELQRQLEVAGEGAFKTNPRYRCLDPKPDDVSPFLKDGVSPSFMIFDFDEAVADLNDRRVAKLMRSTPEFEKYKYAIVGAQICMSESFRSDPSPAFAGWIPQTVLMSFTNDSSILPALRKSTDLKETMRTEFKRMEREDKAIAEEQKRAIADLKAGKTPNFKVSTNPTMCQGRPLEETLHSATVGIKEPALFGKYQADSELRKFRGRNGPSPELRFLFEGRGISMKDWSTDPTAGEYKRAHQFATRHLLALEPQGTPLKDLEPLMRKAKMIVEPNAIAKGQTDEDTSVANEVCAKLRKLSYEAFEKASDEPGSAPKPQNSKSVR